MNRFFQFLRSSPAILFMFVLQTSFSQTDGDYFPASECSNYNAFMSSETFADLKYYTDTIYPGGIMRLDLSKSNEYAGIEDLHRLLGVGTGSSFALINTVNSRFNNDKQYLRYQQYYYGIKVEGGGYTVARTVPQDPGDPCDALAYMLSPHIVSEISLNVSPNVTSQNLDAILNYSVVKSGTPLTDADIEAELVITHNLMDSCEYHLTWKTQYAYEGGKTSWIDGHTGIVLKTMDGHINLNAPTEIYGNKNLNDKTIGNTTTLETPDGRVIAFDFSNFSNCKDREILDFAGASTPSTTASNWTTSVAPSSMYQCFYVTSSLMPVFDGIGIHFEKMSVGIDCQEENAYALLGSTIDDAYIVIGGNSANSFGVFDIIAHEIAHTYLFEFLDNTNLGNKTLHEGIADMIGTYAESIIQGNVDWVIGDDLAALAGAAGRDLQNPEFDCYTEPVNSEPHDRSTPLSHWFYIISQGKGDIPGLGINKAIKIVLESLNLMGPNDGISDMRAAVVAFVEDEFGLCSPEALTVLSAWHEICAGPSHYTDCFTIEGYPIECEEEDYMHLWIGNPTMDVEYKWNFPIEWTVSGATGNVFIGEHLYVTSFPQYNWYPRTFNIKVSSTDLGPVYTQYKLIRLTDCDNDDPTCLEYNNLLQGGGENGVGNKLTTVYSQATEESGKLIAILKAYDLMGRLLYTGVPEGFDRDIASNIGFVVFSYFNESGGFVKSEIGVLLKH